jgi:hypothetical protein
MKWGRHGRSGEQCGSLIAVIAGTMLAELLVLAHYLHRAARCG